MSSCAHGDVVLDADTRAQVCMECGLVLLESVLVDVSPYDAASHTVPAARDERYWQQYRLIDSLCQRFSLGTDLASRASQIFIELKACEGTMVSQGKKGNMAAACSVLSANRQNARPVGLSIADIAAAINESVLTLGKFWTHLKKTAPRVIGAEKAAEAELFVERFMTEAVLPVLDESGVVLESPRAVQRLAEDLCRLGGEAWLDVGRKPEPFALASLLLALDSILTVVPLAKTRGMKLKQRLVFGKPQKLQICEAAGCPYRTVSVREDELFAFFLKEAPVLLPWDVTRLNLLAHLEDLVKVMKRMEPSSVGPPAFDVALKHEADMKAAIEKARLHLEGKQRAIDTLTEMDLVIERLLLKKIPESEISACFNTGQLYSLLSLHEPISDNSDRDDL